MWFGGLTASGPRHPSVLLRPAELPHGDRYRPMRGLGADGVMRGPGGISCRGLGSAGQQQVAAIMMVISASQEGRAGVLAEHIHPPDVAAQRVEAAMP